MTDKPATAAEPEAEQDQGDDVASGVELTELTRAASLTAALARAQANFPAIAKTQTATVHGKDGKAGYTYKYADVADVLGAVRPVLAAEGLAVVQRTTDDGGNTVKLRTELRHVAGGVLPSDITIHQSPGNPQQFGGALTYLRRYELTTLLGIAAEEDRDGQDVEQPNGRQPPAEPPPAWARPASKARKGELGGALTPLIGRDRAASIIASIEASLGVTPDIVVGVAKLIGGLIVETPPGELADGVRALVDARQDAAEAAGATKAQDAAEEPDPPAPADDPTNPPDTGGSDGVHGGPAEPTPAEQAKAAAEAASAEQARANATAEVPPAEPAGPAPGSVELPDIEGAKPDEARKVLAAAGCTCTDPLKPDNDACPLVNHGIPF